MRTIPGVFFDAQRRFLSRATTAAIALALLALQARAGSLTVNGDLTVASNLTAQSISLGGVT